MARFEIGDCGDLGGILWRVSEGKKSANDKRLDICAPSWSPVPMNLHFLGAHFYAENERALALDGYFPAWVAERPAHKFLHAMERATEVGFEVVSEQLRAERTLRRSRGT